MARLALFASRVNVARAFVVDVGESAAWSADLARQQMANDSVPSVS